MEWGKTITEQDDFKKKEMDEYRAWLEDNGFDWEDPKLSLGYIKIGQVDLQRTFGTDASTEKIHRMMSDKLDIKSIRTIFGPTIETDYPYTLDSADWKQIQMEALGNG